MTILKWLVMANQVHTRWENRGPLINEWPPTNKDMLVLVTLYPSLYPSSLSLSLL